MEVKTDKRRSWEDKPCFSIHLVSPSTISFAQLIFPFEDLDDLLQYKVSLNSHSVNTPFCPPSQPSPIVTAGNTILLQTNETFQDYVFSWYEAVSRGRNQTIDEVMYASDAQWLATSQVGSSSILGAIQVPRYLRSGSVYVIYGLINDVHKEEFWILPLCLTISLKSQNTPRNVPSVATPGRSSHVPKNATPSGLPTIYSTTTVRCEQGCDIPSTTTLWKEQYTMALS
ncbi:hypothetical protein BGW36DRAFT_362928 [Talaromyces proteolyticus]|uniref:Uncharacterized protein n=1 Tax=Talaromyces proteolyticus TaxID=1131652 RepID=A0AAD4PU64_9EURO|nr:uncharacterized protein BGW36DRAFT_362928 [Talaromyces proteolyticus]KAH8691900.1 hypothetical protein BGW36DRAFT_362928 [Talaromyces proteolyticus]